MQKNIQEITTLADNQDIKIELENGIIIATYKNSFIDLEIAKKMIHTRLKASAGKNYPVLVKIKSVRDCTKEARDFLAEKGCEGVIAGAILADSIFENMIANLFIYLNKPLIPTKVFKDKTKAKQWLEQFLSEN